jgi:diguanylate cyclase
MVPIIVINLVLYGFGMVCLGAAVAWWLRGVSFKRKARNEGKTESRYATEVLHHLQELATRVAVDVDEHSSQVEKINEKLESADKRESTIIIDVVASLIQANQQMQKKLATTEDKLREQAQEIQIHVAEARTDALTLLANRRAFDDELIRRVAEFRRLGRTFSLIMADVDHFKKFNDAQGHQVGDEVLRGVAKLLRRSMREMDLVARYGGEEFAVILPGTILEDAAKAAFRACETIEKSRFRGNGNDGLRVTVSFGVTELQENENSAMLVMRADKALYASKENGRNCVFCHDGNTVRQVMPLTKPAPLEAEAARQEKPETEPPDHVAKSVALSPAENSESPPKLADPGKLVVVSDLPTRTNFCQQVRNRAAEWKRGGPAFSVLLIEVHDSECREEHPRPRADELATLKIARHLLASIREMDVLGSYAPGCVALLLPGAEIAAAIRVAERLQEEFSKDHPKTPSEQPRIALSVGVAQILESDDFISLLKRAEEALDAADRRTGNQTFYHDGKRCAPITAMMEMMSYLT